MGGKKGKVLLETKNRSGCRRPSPFSPSSPSSWTATAGSIHLSHKDPSPHTCLHVYFKKLQKLTDRCRNSISVAHTPHPPTHSHRHARACPDIYIGIYICAHNLLGGMHQQRFFE